MSFRCIKSHLWPASCYCAFLAMPKANYQCTSRFFANNFGLYINSQRKINTVRIVCCCYAVFQCDQQCTHKAQAVTRQIFPQNSQSSPNCAKKACNWQHYGDALRRLTAACSETWFLHFDLKISHISRKQTNRHFRRYGILLVWKYC